MSAQAISDWFAAHEPVVYKHIGLGIKAHKPVYTDFMHVGETENQIQDMAVWGGPNTFDRHLENEVITPKKIVQSWKKRHTAVFYTGMLTASKESLTGLRYKELETKAKKLGRAGQVTPDYLCALLLDRAFTDVEIGDGLSIYSTVHPLPQSGTESNMISDALSHAGLESAIVALSQLKNWDGVPEQYDVGAIVVHPSKWPLLQTLLKTEKRTGGLFNDRSFVYDEAGDWKLVKNRFLTSTSHWHLITDVTTKMEDGLFLDWIEKLNYQRDNVMATRQAQFIGAMGMVYGCRDWHGAFGSNSAT